MNWLRSTWWGSREARGYLFWGPIVVVILVTEALGAGSNWLGDHLHIDIPWPTISWTIGQIEARHTWVAAVVVGVIAMIGFAVTTRPGGARFGDPPEDEPPGTLQHPHLTAAGLLIFSIAPAAFAGLIARHYTEDQRILGDVIYGALAFYGVLVPSAYQAIEARLHPTADPVVPSFLFAVRRLRRRFPPVAVIIVGGFGILTIHLATYPWPDIEPVPAKYADITGLDAQKRAEGLVTTLRAGRATYSYSAKLRFVDQGRPAWAVFFSRASETNGATDTRCVVYVTRKSTRPTPECAA